MAAAQSPARRLLHAAALLLLCLGLWQFGQGAWIHAKAWLAQALIERAWSRTLAGEAMAKPWPWADTWPVARLRAPRLGVARDVLAGANGRSIAFGPGHLFGTPLPGQAGNSVVAAHRDTHFRFLRQLAAGDEFVVQMADGRRRRYRVAQSAVVDKRDLDPVRQGDGTRLTLVTCYPFDALRAGGPLRYVVTAVAEGAPPSLL